jgi:S-formylglutathione hydrolase FrmB
MALVHVNFHSDVLGMAASMDVIIPQQSHTLIGMSTSGGGTCKTLYLLHGLSDDHTIWQRRTSIERYAAKYDLAVVMPNAHRSWYTDMEHGGKFFTFISEELPRVCRSFFRCMSDKREDNYVAGLSMGGYGALLHGLQNPARYSAIGAFSPGIPDPGAPLDPHRVMREDLFQLTEDALKNNAVLPDLFLCIGDRDFLYERVSRYHQTFGHRWNRSRYRYDDLPGYDHEFAIWDIEVLAFLEWIRREDIYHKLGKNKV